MELSFQWLPGLVRWQDWMLVADAVRSTSLIAKLRPFRILLIAHRRGDR